LREGFGEIPVQDPGYCFLYVHSLTLRNNTYILFAEIKDDKEGTRTKIALGRMGYYTW